MYDAFYNLLDPGPAFVIVAGAAALAGFVRGFSGFGAAMVYMPIASAAIGPIPAVVMLQVFDTIPTLPLVARAARRCTWKEVLPLAICATATAPVGVWLLVTLDGDILRWAISLFILTAVAALATGWRYEGTPKLPVTAATGAAAGISGGVAALSGPPVILFWMAGQSDHVGVRSNMLVFLGLLALVNIALYAANDLFTLQNLVRGMVLVPLYALAVWAGARLFGRTGERLYRNLAFGLIAAAALLSLPLFD